MLGPWPFVFPDFVCKPRGNVSLGFDMDHFTNFSLFSVRIMFGAFNFHLILGNWAV